MDVTKYSWFNYSCFNRLCDD